MAGSAPARIYPVNCIHAIRGRVKAPFIGKVEIGTLPAGAFVVRTDVHVITLFNGTTPTVDVGTAAVVGAFALTAGVIPGTAGYKPGLVGSGNGNTLVADTPVVVTVGSGGGLTTGDVDIVVSFYPQKT